MTRNGWRGRARRWGRRVGRGLGIGAGVAVIGAPLLLSWLGSGHAGPNAETLFIVGTTIGLPLLLAWLWPQAFRAVGMPSPDPAVIAFVTAIVMTASQGITNADPARLLWATGPWTPPASLLDPFGRTTPDELSSYIEQSGGASYWWRASVVVGVGFGALFSVAMAVFERADPPIHRRLGWYRSTFVFFLALTAFGVILIGVFLVEPNRGPHIGAGVVMTVAFALGAVAGRWLWRGVFAFSAALPYLRALALPAIGFISGYVVIIGWFAMWFRVVNRFDPPTFSDATTGAPIEDPEGSQYLYFAALNMLTLGHSNLVPYANWAKTLAVLQGIVGMVWTVVVFAEHAARAADHEHGGEGAVAGRPEEAAGQAVVADGLLNHARGEEPPLDLRLGQGSAVYLGGHGDAKRVERPERDRRLRQQGQVPRRRLCAEAVEA